ncbi:MAG: IS1182 family transposase [candidate division NC10 bacterium]|nr:IS1182 family transposase [candidate division NC10 bacterium]
MELTPTDLEALLPPGHAARLVWRFVEGLDLQRFYAPIRAREGWAGRPAIDPKILVALWLYATIDGVGSAREVDRLCYAHDAYRWLRGGVSVNHHTLSDFRVGHQGALDQLLTQSITVLLDQRVVTLNRIAQDGTKVRASAGVRSFRRRERLEACRQMARQQVTRTRAQLSGECAAGRAAAQARAAEEKLARVEEALAQLPRVEAAKKRNGTKSVARTSTTDPDARVMKMMDGGYRPAYNVQFATDVDGRAIVGVAVTNGSEQAELVPMLAQVQARTGRAPEALLADGGYVSTAGICGVAARGVALYAPVPDGSQAPGSGQTPPPPAVMAWRARMATEEGKTQYKVRAATAERINADAHTHRALREIPVRGLPKVRTWALWTALAINVLRVMEIVPYQMT